ncbi:hypothetical protein BD779DRAFT_1677575 [Infundibulicybe gibba]|nr:hypothetical protein BD779DRAFT_1677575 [Infundibulicybe gibba]
MVRKKVESKSHVNFLEGLLATLRKRPRIIFLKRLSIILDHDSEKGFGLPNIPPPTAHIIILPLAIPRLSFRLRHPLVRTALKNGAVFEILYVGALGEDNDAVLSDAIAVESGPGEKRNWRAASKELMRVTKGKGLIVSGGVVAEADCRAPRNVVNVISLLDRLRYKRVNLYLANSPIVSMRALEIKQTYRAVLPDPRFIIPPTILTDSVAAETVSDPQDMLTDDAIKPKKRAHSVLDLLSQYSQRHRGRDELG